MSSETVDNLVFEQAMYDEPMEKPFLKKDYIFVPDTNPSSSYSTNQITFTTEVLANNGKYNAYNEGIISLPLVVVARRSTLATVNGVADSAMSDNDYLLALKNSHVNLIHSMSVDYNNSNAVQPVQYLNSYLTFKQHSEMSTEDEELNGPLLGYAKDSSTSWSYSAGESVAGRGIMNHFNPILKVNGGSNYEGATENSGMVKRQGYFGKFQNANGKELVMISTDDEGRKKNCTNMIHNPDVNTKVIYYDCTIRLKDLPFFQNLPPIRSGTLRINLTLNNNVSFTFQKLANGNVVYNPQSFANTSGLTNPLMISPSTTAVRMNTKFTSQALATDVGASNIFLPCGASCLPANDVNVYTVSMAIGQQTISAVEYKHTKQQCRLYVPYYQFSPKAESLYLQNRERTINYLDVEYYPFDVKAGQPFTQLITNGLSRMKRLIMIGYISPTANGSEAGGAFSPLSSPFATEPATTSPFMISNFNVQVGQINLYPNAISYSYEQFLQEMNGQYGINGNMIQGSTSSRISLVDYNNNYHYIVVNLDRKLPENELTSQSLGVSGTLESRKDMSFMCFVERYKTITINIENGARVNG
jgi:hypothetical protein